MPLPSHYTKLGVIGKGPNSEVFRGYDSDLERDVAFKYLDIRSGEAVELQCAFKSRASFLASTQNPFFVKVLHSDLDPDCPMVVMDLAKHNFSNAFIGDNLTGEILERKILDCLKALNGIHQGGFQHGNLSPSNILFFENDAVKFSDPSVVSDIMRSPPSSAKYLVPELAAKDRWLKTSQLGSQIDIYQLGFCILETIGGNRFLDHFPGAKLKEVDQEQFWWNWHAGTESFDPIIENVVPKKFRRIQELLKKMLEKDPSKRASSSGELLDWFERNCSYSHVKENQVAADKNITSASESTMDIFRLIMSRKLASLLVAVCVVALFLSGVFYVSMRSNLKSNNDDPIIQRDTAPNSQKLTIESAPDKASIILDGKNTGKYTPSTLDLNNRKNEITLEIQGLKKIQFTRDLEFDRPDFRLEDKILKEFELVPSVTIIDIRGIKLELVEINPIYFQKGVYQMGSTKDEQDEAIKNNNNAEETLIRSERLHTVTLTNPFSISKFVISRKTFKKFLNDCSYQVENKNSSFQDDESDDDLPAVDISWKDANEFCKWLTNCHAPAPGSFSLPTESEWEFACRCGSRAPFSFDDKDGNFRKYANFNNEFSPDRKLLVSILKPGQLLPNPWGIYDMHGNVWQYCSDFFGDFNGEDELDPKGPPKGSSHVIRGGSYAVNKFMGRSASRIKMEDHVISDKTTGFRVVFRPNAN